MSQVYFKRIVRGLWGLGTSLVFTVTVTGQFRDLAVLYPRADESVSHLLFDHEAAGFAMLDAYRVPEADLGENHPRLTVGGDFNGDGVDELALFDDLAYTPNLNPGFTCSVIRMLRSTGDRFLPSGTWFSVPDTALSFDLVDFSVAGDFNLDGFSDIALFYNDPASEQMTIYVLESNGSGFSGAIPWYTTTRNEFNFTAVKFACAGDFNGNAKPDIALFYNYFGTVPETPQAVFVFESNGQSFDLLPAAYQGTKAAYDFSDMQFASSGDFNMDSYTDLAVWMTNPAGTHTQVPVFVGSGSGQLTPVNYYSAPVSSLDIQDIGYAVSGDFSGNEASDQAVFHHNPGNGNQEILVLESQLSSFAAPVAAFSSDPGNFLVSGITSAVPGSFVHEPLVVATTWQDDRKGAVSFTFDDGYRGAFEHGAAELEAAGWRGSFYIFTDTTLTYDGELAGTSLVRAAKNKGHEIGSHTSNHSDLGLLAGSGNYDSISRVLGESVDILNQRFNQNTYSMSIPFGSFRYEVLDSISNHFLSARSSQYGFNLATPYDFYALKSWPILSTTSPAFVDNLLSLAESHGHYLPLLYHDMTDEAFDEAVEIYNYGRDQFRETLVLAGSRDVWIDTHLHIYKYIRERNALKIGQVELGEADAQPGHFSFVAADDLADSVFNVPLTLKIRLPGSWTEDSATVETGEEQLVLEVQSDAGGMFVYSPALPVEDRAIHVYEGRKSATRVDAWPDPRTVPGLAAFPNPFRQETLIRVSGGEPGDMTLVLRDIQGRIHREVPLYQNETIVLSRENLSPGLYVLQLMESGIPVATLKLIAR